MLVRLFEKEKGIRKNIEKSRFPQKEKPAIKPINISSFVFTPKKVAVFLIIILILVGFVYLYLEIGSFSSTPRLVVFSPQDNAQIKSNSVFIEGVTDKDAKLFINNQLILVSDDGKFRENVTVQPGVNVINVKSVNKFNKEAMEVVRVEANYEEGMASGGDDNNSGENGSDTLDGDRKTQGLQIELRVDPGPVWLSVEADDNLVFSGTMLTGSTQIFKAQNKILINSGKANATFVKFNGKDIGTLGPEAKAIRGVTFNRDTKY